ncbi:MAG: sulfotransferase [Methylococcaceae bacterium]
MNISRSIPCGLFSEQVDVVLRDICRDINYSSPNKEIARKTAFGLQCLSGWRELPEWIHSAELHVLEGEIKLNLCTDNADVTLADLEKAADGIQDDLSSLFSYKTRPFPNKVFCIGWSKTGTVSLTEALRMLGIFSRHFTPWIIGATYFDSDVSETAINFSSIADYTSVSDVPVCALFRELDQTFPGSKFILTTRPPESWIESAVLQHESLIERQGIMDPASRWVYGTDQIDRQLFLNRYLQHHQQVLEYFKYRSDLLAIDIAEDNQWQKLCDFLNLPIPDCPFPYLNRRAVSNNINL